MRAKRGIAAALVAAVSCVTYVIAGFAQTPLLPLTIGVLLMIGVLYVMKSKNMNLE